MNIIYRITIIFVLLLAVLASNAQQQEQLLGGGCSVNFDLFGNDTICTSAAPLELPPVLPLGGVYSGPNVVGNIFDPAGLSPGDYVLTYTYTNETCTASDDVTITIVESSPLGIGGETNVCYGGSTVLYSLDGQEFTWEDGSKSASKTFTLTSDLSTYVTGTDVNGCVVQQPLELLVLGLSENTQFSDDTTVCSGELVTFSVLNGGNFYWNDGITSPSISFIADQDSVVSLNFILGTNCDTTIMISALVVPLPPLVVVTDTSICYGDSTLIVASGAVYYKTQFSLFDGTLEVLLEDDFTYIIQGYNELDCPTTIPVTIVVNDIPVLNFTGIDTLCRGESVSLQVSGADYYSWYDNDLQQEINTEIPDQYSATPDQTLNLSVTGVSLEECSSTEVVVIPVNPMPELAIDVLTPFCDGEIVTLLATGADFFQWSTGDQDSLYQFVGDEDFSFVLYGQTQFGCSDSLPYDAVIHPVPVVTAFGVLTICEGDTTTLTALGADTYTWNGILTGDVVDVWPAADSIINVIGVTEFGCSDFTNVNINVNPAPILNLSGDQEICYGESTTITVFTDGEFVWDDGGSDLVVVETPEDDSTYHALATASNGCTREGFFPVVVYDLPLMSVSGDNNICQGETISLIATGAYEYEWSNDALNDTIVVSPFITTNYRVTGYSIEGCESDLIYPVTVLPSPYVYFQFSEESICDLGPELTWIANPSGGVLSGDGVTDNWFNPGDALVGVNTVTYTVTNEFDCSATAVDEIVVDDCSGIEENLSGQIQLFPNPADDFISVRLSGSGYEMIRVFDAEGRMVLSMPAKPSVNIELSNFESGIYHVIITGTDGSHTSARFVRN